MNEAMLIGVAIGLLYAYLGLCLVVCVEARTNDVLHDWVGASIPRGLVVLVAWPVALVVALAVARVARHA